MSYLTRVNKRVNHPFDLVLSDIWGPCSIRSKLDFQYFITFVDDYLHVTWHYLMKSHFKIFSIFQNFVLRLKSNLTLL